MKSNIFIKGFSALAAVAALASCSSDYLDNKPITDIESGTVTESTKAAKMAIEGMCRGMYTQYQDVSYPRGMNGEGTLAYSVNETLGCDYVSYFMMREMGLSYYTWSNITDPTNTDITTAWMYCYNLIGQANSLIGHLDDAEGPVEERQFIEAQALTFRAFGYLKALQWFGPRWQDSNEGAKMSVVLRKEAGVAACPLASMKEVVDFIYSDLDRAISLYKSSGLSRANSFEPDLRVAYGIYARTALLREDWSTAAAMAHNAREGMQVMSNEDYLSGFVKETDGYLWTNPENDIYYSSTGSWYSCNGAYPCNWSRGSSINIDLYRKLDPNDIRRKTFFTPDKVADVAALQGYEDVADITEADFYNENVISVSDLNLLPETDENNNVKDPAKAKYAKLCRGFAKYAASLSYNSAGEPRIPYSLDNTPEGLTSMMFGAQTKMWSSGFYGDSKFPYMRVAEMILIEAEANYMLGNEPAAISALKEINTVRIPGYDCTKSGDALLDEIRTTRRIELWGEGFCFTDFKRWNIPMEERAWVANDVTSGNCPATYSRRHETSEANGWRLAIPQSESDYNSKFNRADLN